MRTINFSHALIFILIAVQSMTNSGLILQNKNSSLAYFDTNDSIVYDSNQTVEQKNTNKSQFVCYPPTAGTAFIYPAGIKCVGTDFELNVNGSTYGSSGETYKWQQSSNATGPFTDMGNPPGSIRFTVTATTNMFYRAVASCGTYSDTSTVVEVTVDAGLAGGTYTINSGLASGGNNFRTIAEVQAVLRCGINGPVTFNVEPGSGPYTDPLVLNELRGTSATNRLIFNGNGATISDATNPNALGGIILYGTDYVTINNFNIDVAAGTMGWGIYLTSKADHNTITNNTIHALGSTDVSHNFLGIVIGESKHPIDSAGSYNLVSGNTINGGYFGIMSYTNNATGNVFTNNIVRDAYTYSIYLTGNNDAIIRGNNISRPTKKTTPTLIHGISLGSWTSGIIIEKNRIHNMFDSLPASNASFLAINNSGNATVITNNLIYNIGGNGRVTGIDNGGDSMQAYHNTIIFDDTTTTNGEAYGFITGGTSATKARFQNNLIHISRRGPGIKRAIYILSFISSSETKTNYNNLYLSASQGTNNHVGQYGSTNYTTLAQWKSALGGAFDQQSVSFDAGFLNPPAEDFTPTNSKIDNKGGATIVSTDIRDSARSNSTPDIGAYEFITLTPGNNMRAEALLTPVTAAGGCYSNNETLQVRIKNFKTTAMDFSADPVIITVTVTGAVTKTFKDTLTSGTLPSDTTMVVSMSQKLDMTATGNYKFNGYTSVAGDVNVANDAMPEVNRTKQKVYAGIVSASRQSFCMQGAPVLKSLGITGIGNLQWQHSTLANSGFTDMPGGTTTPFTVPAFINQTMYYRLIAACYMQTDTSTNYVVELLTPTITAIKIDSFCSPGTVTLVAKGNAGSTIEWYTTPTGGQPIFTGDTLYRNLTTTTTFYAEPGIGTSTTAAPLLITEFDLGTSDQLEIQNVSQTVLDVTGWRIAVSNNYTNINSVNATVKTLSGTMASGEIKTWNDANWGSNILWNPNEQGWAAILDNNNNLVDIVFLKWPEAAINSANIVIGSTPINPASKWSGNGIDVTTVAATNGVSRKGNSDNNNSTDFLITPLSIASSNTDLSVPFAGLRCAGARIPVTASSIPKGKWLGTTSTLWENPSNWSCNVLPDGNTAVIIPAGAVVVISTPVYVYSMTVHPSAVVTISSGGSLTVYH